MKLHNNLTMAFIYLYINYILFNTRKQKYAEYWEKLWI